MSGIEINLGVVLQVVIAAVLVGVGKVVWQTSVAVAKLAQKLDDHTAQDERNFVELRRLGQRARLREQRR